VNDKNPIIHVWITKYALTTGITEADLEHVISISEQIVSDGRGMVIHKPFWHTSRDKALDHVRAMAANAIKSHNKSIRKLEVLLKEVH
jgi:hypothetical protein